MVRQDIITAIKNSVDRGSDLSKTAQIMINSGYNVKDIIEAIEYIAGGISKELREAIIQQAFQMQNQAKQTIQETPKSQEFFEPNFQRVGPQNLKQRENIQQKQKISQRSNLQKPVYKSLPKFRTPQYQLMQPKIQQKTIQPLQQPQQNFQNKDQQQNIQRPQPFQIIQQPPPIQLIQNFPMPQQSQQLQNQKIEEKELEIGLTKIKDEEKESQESQLVQFEAQNKKKFPVVIVLLSMILAFLVILLILIIIFREKAIEILQKIIGG